MGVTIVSENDETILPIILDIVEKPPLGLIWHLLSINTRHVRR